MINGLERALSGVTTQIRAIYCQFRALIPSRTPLNCFAQLETTRMSVVNDITPQFGSAPVSSS